MNGVKTLDFPLPASVQEGYVYGIRAHYGSRVLEARRSQPIAVLVRRETFDAFLAEKALEAGADLHLGEKVLGLEESQHYVTVKTSRGHYRSRYVIVAYGASGVLNRPSRGFVGATRRVAPTLKCQETLVPATRGKRWKAVTRRETLSSLKIPSLHKDPFLEFYFDAYPMGYGWVFPLQDGFSIGVGGLHTGTFSTRKAFFDFLRKFKGSEGAPYRGSIIPCPGIASVLGTSRILYAGDAGGFGEAFSGEGIYYAMRSGQLASETIVDALQGLLQRPLHQVYRARCLRVLGDNLRYAAFFAKWVYQFPGFFVHLFARKKLWAQEFLGIPLGETTYKHFLLKRFSFGLLGNNGR